jgi:hypothetical protein
MAIATGDKEQHWSGAFVAIMKIATFIVDDGMSSVNSHGYGDGVARRDSLWVE